MKVAVMMLMILMRMTIMILLKMMTTMMMIALVPNSICFNKVAAAEVGPRASNRTGCTFAKKIDGDEDGDYRGGG